MRRLALALSISLLAYTAPLAAQSEPPSPDARAAMLAAAQKAMAPFAWLAGEWEGTATVYMGNGGTMAIVQHETVTSAAFNTALLIQGRGSMTANGTARQVWDAAAVFAYDVPSKAFSFMSASGSGMASKFAVEPHGAGFTWLLNDGTGARTRYVITRTADGQWHEIGETSRDGGTTWTKTIELLLSKTK